MWYVRSRGRVMGPFPESSLRVMRSGGQVQGYDEVSQDRMSWEAIDLCPVFTTETVAPPPTVPRYEPETRFPPNTTVSKPTAGSSRPRRPGSSIPRKTWMIAGGVLAGSVLLVFVFSRLSRQPGGIVGSVTGLASGAIQFPAGMKETDRTKTLESSVALLVAGDVVTLSDGSKMDKPRSTGTGFVVGRSGYLMTNKHVVEDVVNSKDSSARTNLEKKLDVKIQPKLWVFFGKDQKFEGDIIHVSENYDMAIIKVDHKFEHYFALSDRPDADIPLLEGLSAVGFPGVDREPLTDKEVEDKIRRNKSTGPIQSHFPDNAFVVSKRSGSVTKRATKRQMDDGQAESYVLQHTATIFGGNSGGPLINNAGLVIGINTWSQNKSVRDKTGKVILDQGNINNINYALTLPQLRAEIDRHVKDAVWMPLTD